MTVFDSWNFKLTGMQFVDSDESSLWSSSTETTNVDERSSLTEYQQITKIGPGSLTI